MKLKNILFSLLAVLVSLFGTTVKAATTTAPESYGIKYSDMHKIIAGNYLPDYDLSFYYKVNTQGKVVYCIDFFRSYPTGNPTMYYRGETLSAKYAYILENGYPNKSMTGNNDKDYFITGMAFWYLVDPSNYIFKNFNMENGTFRGSSNEIANWMSKLVKGANSYSYVNPKITINNSNSNMTLSSDKKYYVSTMSVKTTGTVGNYTVSLSNAPAGTIVTDKNGTTKNTFGTSESFTVKVPVSSIKELSNSFTVSVNAEGSINKAYIYSPSDSSIQRTAALYPEKNNISDSTTLKIDITTTVEISKVDATTGKELPGAKLTVKDVTTKKVVDSWTSTNEVHIIKGLKPGKYTLTEEIAPKGYILSTETITFEVKNDGSVTKVKMENKPEEPKVVYISKQDVTTGEELPGAKLELRNEKKELVEAWVSTDEPHKVKGLEPGKYYLTEILAPEGYELSKETVEFTVKEDGTVDGKVIMYNKPETVVVVPPTSSFKTITTSLIGLIIMGLGSIVIYRNYKKNNG